MKHKDHPTMLKMTGKPAKKMDCKPGEKVSKSKFASPKAAKAPKGKKPGGRMEWS